ncbi:GPI mannosyltransferase 2 [Eurosta solidaginis]|uniref:GPI mannosyltransferase 2 n=1 Tax=Eurosta solidaginis TaxID=178769 RepID=UPI0035312EE0
MTEKVTKLAFASRVIILILQLLANHLLPDHKPDVFRAPIALQEKQHHLQNHQQHTNEFIDVVTNITDTSSWLDRTVQFCLGGLRHWDGEYFLHIAEYSYTYENTLAFYPLFPLVVRAGANALYALNMGVSLRSWCLVIAVLVNVFCFCKAANTLYELTQRIFKDPNKSWNAVLLFCFNPASIFFTAAYSEALFCWLSLHLMLECVSEFRFVRTTITLALSIVSRSNGLLNAGYPIYFMLRHSIVNHVKKTYRCFTTLKLVTCILAALMPLTFFYFYAFEQFCMPDRTMVHTSAVLDYGRKRNYILAGQRNPENSPWCDKTFPFPYSYIQSHYWNVGFLRYYEVKQLPNFMLALPVLAFLLYHCVKYFRHFLSTLLPNYPFVQLLKEYKSLPFVLHALLLTVFCTFFVHVQISTRLLCSATPCLYWFAADQLPKTFDQIKLRSKAGSILVWFTSYYLIGTALFCNNLPWT